MSARHANAAGARSGFSAAPAPQTTQDATRAANAKGEGFKADAGKDQWRLLPWRALREVVRVLTAGAVKYDPDNWKLVPHARDRYTDALFRHITAWIDGERRDPETGLHHLAHACCCLLFLLHFDLMENDQCS